MTTEMQDERRNLPSASSMRRVRTCPGSVGLVARLKASSLVGNDDTADSREGTARHSLIEMGVDTETIEDSNAQYVVERFNQLLDEARIAARLNGCETTTLKETRYWIYDSQMNRVCSAKLDHLEFVASMGVGLVADAKTLFGTTHGTAAKSEQLAVQAVAAAETHGLNEVYVALIQPNLAKDRQLSIAYYDRPALIRSQAEIIAWCKAAQAVDAPRIPGPQCENCIARGPYCPESQAASLAVSVSHGVEVMTPTQIEWFLERTGAMEAVIGAVQEKAKAMLEADPNAFGGRYTLEPGKQRRSITDANRAFAVAEQFGVPLDEYRAVLGVSIGDLEKLAAKHSGTPAKDAKKALAKALTEAGILEVKQNKSSLKMVS